MPLPSMAGWLMPSRNPNGSVSVGSAWQSWRQIAVIPGELSVGLAGALERRLEPLAHPGRPR